MILGGALTIDGLNSSVMIVEINTDFPILCSKGYPICWVVILICFTTKPMYYKIPSLLYGNSDWSLYQAVPVHEKRWVFLEVKLILTF